MCVFFVRLFRDSWVNDIVEILLSKYEIKSGAIWLERVVFTKECITQSKNIIKSDKNWEPLYAPLLYNAQSIACITWILSVSVKGYLATLLFYCGFLESKLFNDIKVKVLESL
jgi:hypothetical protein